MITKPDEVKVQIRYGRYGKHRHEHYEVTARVGGRAWMVDDGQA